MRSGLGTWWKAHGIAAETSAVDPAGSLAAARAAADAAALSTVDLPSRPSWVAHDGYVRLDDEADTARQDDRALDAYAYAILHLLRRVPPIDFAAALLGLAGALLVACGAVAAAQMSGLGLAATIVAALAVLVEVLAAACPSLPYEDDDGPLLDGWGALADENGKLYYVHDATQSTTWMRPSAQGIDLSRLPEAAARVSILRSAWDCVCNVLQRLTAVCIMLALGLSALLWLAVGTYVAPASFGVRWLSRYAIAVQLVDTSMWLLRCLPGVSCLIDAVESCLSCIGYVPSLAYKCIEGALLRQINEEMRRAHATIVMHAIEPQDADDDLVTSPSAARPPASRLVRLLRMTRRLAEKRDNVGQALLVLCLGHGFAHHGAHVRASPFKMGATLASLVVVVDAITLDSVLSLLDILAKSAVGDDPSDARLTTAAVMGVGENGGEGGLEGRGVLAGASWFPPLETAWLQPLAAAIAGVVTAAACSTFVRERLKVGEFKAACGVERAWHDRYEDRRTDARRAHGDDEEKASRLFAARRNFDDAAAAEAASDLGLPPQVVEKMRSELSRASGTLRSVEAASARVPCACLELRAALETATVAAVPIDMLMPHWYQLQQAEAAQAAFREAATAKLDAAIIGYDVGVLASVLNAIDAADREMRPPQRMIDMADKLLVDWSALLEPVANKLNAEPSAPSARERDELYAILEQAVAAGIAPNAPTMVVANARLDELAIEAIQTEISVLATMPLEAEPTDLLRELERARAIHVPEEQLAPYAKTLTEWMSRKALAEVNEASEAKPLNLAALERSLEQARAVGVSEAALSKFVRTLAHVTSERDTALAAVTAAAEASPIVVSKLDVCLATARRVGVPQSLLEDFDSVVGHARAEQDARLAAVKLAAEPRAVDVAKLSDCLTTARTVGVPRTLLAPFANVLKQAGADQGAALAAVRQAAEASPIVVTALAGCLMHARTVGVPELSVEPFDGVLTKARAEQDAALAAVRQASEANPIVVADLDESLVRARSVGVPEAVLAPHMGGGDAAREEQDAALAAVKAAAEPHPNPIGVAKLEACLTTAQTVGVPESLLRQYHGALATARVTQDAYLAAVREASEAKPIVVAILDDAIARARAAGVPEAALAAFDSLLGRASQEQDKALAAVKAAAESRPVVVATLADCLATARTLGVPEPSLIAFAETLKQAAAEHDTALAAVRQAAEAKPISFADLKDCLEQANAVGVPEALLHPYTRTLADATAAQRAAKKTPHLVNEVSKVEERLRR